MTHHPLTADPHGGASTAPSLTDSRAVLADIIHHDAATLHRAALVLLLRSPDTKEKSDARAIMALIKERKIK